LDINREVKKMLQSLFLPVVFCVVGLAIGGQIGSHFGFDRAQATYFMGTIGSLAGIICSAKYCS
jgi:hypothetical protein